MRRFPAILRNVVLFAAGATLSGCVSGWIVTDVTTPLVRDMRDTKRGSRVVTLSSQFLKVPVTSIAIGAEWDSRAIGEAAKTQGLHDVHFADLRTFSVLGGLYKEQTIEVWGD